MTTATETYRYGRLRIALFAVDVPAVAIGRAVYFPMRALCGALGITAQKQIERLREDSAYRDPFRIVPIPTVKGPRDAVCINKRHVSRWLASIDAARVTPSVRGKLQQFQAELFAAADRWLFGDTSDVVYDPATKSDKPVLGVLHLGDCPRCGLALALVTDATGAHLAPDDEE